MEDAGEAKSCWAASDDGNLWLVLHVFFSYGDYFLVPIYKALERYFRLSVLVPT